jgi:hypothetical protein
MVRALPLINAHFMGTNMRTYKQRSALSDRVGLINIIEQKQIAKQKSVNKVGYVGLCFVQLAIIPNLVMGNAIMMHSSLLIGLCCYQYRNSHDTNKDNLRLYSIGNYTGITLNILMLAKLGGVFA